MPLEIGDQWWKVKGPNKFNNEFRFTGFDGGYYDPDDNRYYTKEGIPSTLDIEFPLIKYFNGDERLYRKVHDHSNDDIWYSGEIDSTPNYTIKDYDESE